MDNRVKSHRLSTLISKAQAKNLDEAFHHAEQIGRPLNTHVTINWSEADIDDQNGRRLGKFRAALSKWCRRREFSLTAIWVREHPGSKGDHAHMMMSLPMKFTKGRGKRIFFQALKRLIKNYGGESVSDQAVQVNYYLEPPFSANRPCRNPAYLMKGALPEVRSQYGVPSRFPRHQGEVSFKRSGTTQNIGPAARRRHTLGRGHSKNTAMRPRPPSVNNMGK